MVGAKNEELEIGEWTHVKTVTFKVNWESLEKWKQDAEQTLQEWRDEMDRQIKEDTDKNRRRFEEYKKIDGCTPEEALEKILKG